jgi:hypothetical protein
VTERNDPLEDVEIRHEDNTEEAALPVEEPQPQTPLDRLKKASSALATCLPVLFFVDELDALGGSRQQVSGGSGDPTGAGREFNTIVTQLMQCIDQLSSAIISYAVICVI